MKLKTELIKNVFKFEDLVLTQIMNLIMDDTIIDSIAEIAVKQQNEENIVLPALRSQLKDVNKSIENILKAIEEGIYTASTKERLQNLEKSKTEIELRISKEEIQKPFLSKHDIVSWFCELRKFNTDMIIRI